MIPFVLVFIWLAVAVWFCSRSPLWLATFIDRHVRGDTDISGYPQVHRDFFAYILMLYLASIGLAKIYA